MKPSIFEIVVISSVMFDLVLTAHAWVWHDDFHGGDLKGWTVKGKFSRWEAEDGMLKVEIVVEPPHEIVFELLQLKAILGPYDDFTIIVKNIGCKLSNIGIGLGKTFPEAPGINKDFFYIFLTNRIDFVPHLLVPFKANRAPRTLWHTYDLKEMKVSFRSGRFRMYVDGKKRADFEDPDFNRVEIVGFEVVGFKGFRGEGWVDSFTIISPAMGVEPKGKLATTWGRMKRW